MSNFRVKAILLLSIVCTATLFLGGFRAGLWAPVTHIDTLTDCFSEHGTSAVNYIPNRQCLQKTVRTLLNRYAPKDILAYTAATSSPIAVLSSCHEIGHVVGEESLKRTGSLESTLSLCPPTCSNGCVHGAIGAEVAHELGGQYSSEDVAHANARELESLGDKYCSRSGSLCHAIGHLFFIALHTFDASLISCDAVSRGDRSWDCYRGVFMESLGANLSLTPSTATSTFPRDDYAYLCSTMSLKYQRACFAYLPGFLQIKFSNNGPRNTDGMLKTNIGICESFSSKTRSYCFEGFGFNGGVTQVDFTRYDAIKLICNELKSVDDRNACVRGIVIKYIFFQHYADAVQYCDTTADTQQKTSCYNLMFGYMRQFASFSNSQILTLCNEAGSSECSVKFAAFIKLN